MDLQVLNFLQVLKTALHEDPNDLSEPDWNRFYACAVHHSILPLINQGCASYRDFCLAPEEIRKRYMSASLRIVMRQARRTNAFLKIYDRLLQEGLKPLVLKGLVCRSTYKGLEDYRPSGDEDILIEKDEFTKYRAILNDAGYLMEDLKITNQLLSRIQHIRFTNPDEGLSIEVHLSFMGNKNALRSKINTYFTTAFQNCISLEINGHMIYTLNHTEHYLYLFFHFLKHFTASGAGIRQILDLYMYDNCYHDEIDWNRVEESIKKMSADKLYADVVAIGREYLGFHIWTSLQGYHKEQLLSDIMAAGIFGNTTSVQAKSRNVTEAALNYRGYHLLNMIFPRVSTVEINNPILLKKPYLLPFVWISRLFHFLYGSGPNKVRFIRDSRSIGKQRLQLLKGYRII